MDRRRFLQIGSAAALGSAAYLTGLWPGSSLAAAAENSGSARVLSLVNTHTGERLKSIYWESGAYRREALRAIDHILRDHRTGESVAMDRRLLEVLFALQRTLQTDEPVHVISGYRSPSSNAQLRRQSRNVARKSYHMAGRAVDLRIPGVALGEVRRAALALRAGGVGYYPRSGFIHVDTGSVRTW
jgi:uncharacterized protein YcbK (DUF882 family)